MCAAFGGVRRKIITRVSDISGTFIFFAKKLKNLDLGVDK
jgi:hypothetical protein